MKTRILAHLGAKPPNWQAAFRERTDALKDARHLDPLEPAWCGLSDDIANAIPDLPTKLQFWDRLERFINPGFLKGHDRCTGAGVTAYG